MQMVSPRSESGPTLFSQSRPEDDMLAFRSSVAREIKAIEHEYYGWFTNNLFYVLRTHCRLMADYGITGSILQQILDMSNIMY